MNRIPLKCEIIKLMRNFFRDLNQKISAIAIDKQKRVVDLAAKSFLIALALLFQAYILLVDAFSNCPIDFCVGRWNNIFLYVLFGVADFLIVLYLFFLPVRLRSILLPKSKLIVIGIVAANVMALLFSIIELIWAAAF